jgi:hypothetical protein
MTLPTVITAAGLQPQSPATLRANLIASVAAQNPGYTANLPGSLIEDIASTDVGALVVCDQARVDLINSLSPYAANEQLLIQLGNIYGIPQGTTSNTSVYVVFSGSVGFPIGPGFTVSDGTYQYTAQEGGIIGSNGQSLPVYCLATVSGVWAVPTGTVTQLITSVPSTITLSVTNPTAGTPGGAAESIDTYRSLVLQAGLVGAQGMATMLKTNLANLPGVQSRLVSARQVGASWEVLCGGGDPYQVANAIYTSLFDILDLTGSTLAVTGITLANPGVVTTNLNHGFTTGQIINIAGVVGMTAVNNTPLTVTVLTQTTFSIGVNTSGYGAYVSGGVVTPNLRNISVSIKDYPDTYLIPFVNPPQQTVAVTVTWNTSATNFISSTAVAQLAQPALTSYVNSISAGQPVNLFQMQEVFQQAVSSIVPTNLLTRLIFSVSINGISTAPAAGTGVISGDPESYFFALSNNIVVNQG